MEYSFFAKMVERQLLVSPRISRAFGCMGKDTIKVSAAFINDHRQTYNFKAGAHNYKQFYLPIIFKTYVLIHFCYLPMQMVILS